MRAERPKGPAIHVLDTTVEGVAIEAAFCLAGGIEKPEARFKAETLEAAHQAFPHGLGIQEFLLRAAARGGVHALAIRQGNVAQIIRAAFSTLEIGGILSNVANRFLLQGFEAVDQTIWQIAAIRNVKDFKTITSYRLTGGLRFQGLGPDGEIKHGTLGNESYTNQVQTRGIMLAITREDIINDDLGALTAVPRMMGRGGMLDLNVLAWTAFLNNAAFFTVARKNYAAGAGTALGINGLTQAEQLFLEQTNTDGHPLAVTPKLLLVPPALSALEAQLMKSLELRDTTTSTKYPTVNPHAGKFLPLTTPYLSNAAIPGYSSAAWYLLADPQDLAVIEIALLNGQRTPIVEQAEANFNTLGIQMRAYFDWGVALQDYRGGVKMKGEA